MAPEQRVPAVKAPEPTNLVPFDGPGSRPKTGDIFIVRAGEFTCPGRVVDTEASIGPMKGTIVAYIFQPVDETWTPEADTSALHVNQLLIAPFFINQKPWSYKLVKRLAQREFQPGERLEQHCFDNGRGGYFDEHSNPLNGPTEPVGTWALMSYRTLDDRISMALGLPRVPHDKS